MSRSNSLYARRMNAPERPLPMNSIVVSRKVSAYSVPRANTFLPRSFVDPHFIDGDRVRRILPHGDVRCNSCHKALRVRALRDDRGSHRRATLAVYLPRYLVCLSRHDGTIAKQIYSIEPFCMPFFRRLQQHYSGSVAKRLQDSRTEDPRVLNEGRTLCEPNSWDYMHTPSGSLLQIHPSVVLQVPRLRVYGTQVPRK